MHVICYNMCFNNKLVLLELELLNPVLFIIKNVRWKIALVSILHKRYTIDTEK